MGILRIRFASTFADYDGSSACCDTVLNEPINKVKASQEEGDSEGRRTFLEEGRHY